MQLEDHAGDIVRKACTMSRLSLKTAAAAAGVSEAELTEFTATGRGAAKINFTALAGVIGLHPQKLTAVANGWLPAKRDLSAWHRLQSVATQNDEMSVNCYLAWDEATRVAALFDTGMDAQPVLALIAAEKLTLQDIFITHTHWDHVEALAPLRSAFPGVRLHLGSRNAPAAQRLQPGETFQIGRLQIAHRDTPGHAEDGVTYLISGWPDNAPPVAVVGDTIFAGSMGNGNGAWELAKQKVKDEILSLPPATLLCPGHGPLTTVAEETAHNPFF
jgi:glyoxylase-like metal-dependent hydrolase (beta-lactamase superfamily II)